MHWDFLKFLETFVSDEQYSSPMYPVVPQSMSDAQFIGVLRHSLIIVPGLMHSSKVRGLLSLQSALEEHAIFKHLPFEQS